jgi:hypothetical protein
MLTTAVRSNFGTAIIRLNAEILLDKPLKIYP